MGYLILKVSSDLILKLITYTKTSYRASPCKLSWCKGGPRGTAPRLHSGSRFMAKQALKACGFTGIFNPTLRWVENPDEIAIRIQGIRTHWAKGPMGPIKLARLSSLADAKRALKARVNNYEGCYVVTPRIVRAHTEVRVFPQDAPVGLGLKAHP